MALTFDYSRIAANKPAGRKYIGPASLHKTMHLRPSRGKAIKHKADPAYRTNARGGLVKTDRPVVRTADTRYSKMRDWLEPPPKPREPRQKKLKRQDTAPVYTPASTVKRWNPEPQPLPNWRLHCRQDD